MARGLRERIGSDIEPHMVGEDLLPRGALLVVHDMRLALRVPGLAGCFVCGYPLDPDNQARWLFLFRQDSVSRDPLPCAAMCPGHAMVIEACGGNIPFPFLARWRLIATAANN